MSAVIQALVVDDSPAMRRQLCYALQRVAGMSAEEAVDGADGWKRLCGGTFHLLITDINMPNLDGLKLVSLVRQTAGAHQRIPIVVSSLLSAFLSVLCFLSCDLRLRHLDVLCHEASNHLHDPLRVTLIGRYQKRVGRLRHAFVQRIPALLVEVAQHLLGMRSGII